MPSSSPFVYWAQDKDSLFFRVDIRDAQDVSAKVDGKRLNFNAEGTGAQGRQTYQFSLPLADKVDTKVQVNTNAARVEIQLTKTNNKEFWDNLTSDSKRLPWLKFDFDRWKDPDGDDENEEDNFDHLGFDDYMKTNERSAYKKWARDLANDFVKDGKSKDANQERLDRLYLFIYNICMFLAHFYVLMVLAYGYTTKRSAYFTHFWEEQHLSFFVCTGLQYMDVLHGMTGMTKSGYKTGLIQVTGRLTALFIIHKNPEIHAVASTFCLMFVYFMIEIFRYPYYSLSSLQIESKPITWLRYNMWIPLYPTGLFLESVTMFRSIPYYYHSEKLGFAMPNIINMSFNFGVFLALFLVTAFPYISYLLLSHMHRQRAKKMNDAEKKRE